MTTLFFYSLQNDVLFIYLFIYLFTKRWYIVKVGHWEVLMETQEAL
jgi:hypothetical protein